MDIATCGAYYLRSMHTVCKLFLTATVYFVHPPITILNFKHAPSILTRDATGLSRDFSRKKDQWGKSGFPKIEAGGGGSDM